MSSFLMGVDLGSTTAKAVIIDEFGSIKSASIVQMGAVSRKAVQCAMEQVLVDARLETGDVSVVVSTGYGRRLVPGAQRTITEITCHARGTAVVCPGVGLVIDIGGQDSKAIKVDRYGMVDSFAMNSRCASGTGRAYENLARAFECDINDLGAVALSGQANLEISSLCAEFAETEVISLLAQGYPFEDIAASAHRAIAARTLALVAQVGRHAPIVLTGGVALNPAAVHFLAEALDEDIQVPECPQLTGALGAAVLALETSYQSSEPGFLQPFTVDEPRGKVLDDGHSCSDCGSNLNSKVNFITVTNVNA